MVLELAAEVHIAVGRALAWTYEKVWSLRKLRYFDHRFDYLRGPHYVNWQERGILGAQAIPQRGKVLDLCCGDGFYTKNYYAPRASHVDGIDLDDSAIGMAKRRNGARNAAFFVGDVTCMGFPGRNYDVVLFFSALHFISEERRTALLSKIVASLKPDGVLVGSATLPRESLQALLTLHFKQVHLWEYDWGKGRIESYFECRRHAT